MNHTQTKAADRSLTARLDAWLETLVAQKGSDLLLVPGAPASIRLEGDVRSIGDALLDGSEIETIVSPALTPHALREYQETHIADSSYRVSGLGRFRINLHREQGLAAAAIRALPSNVPMLKDLNLPPGLGSLAQLPRGLVLIGGPAGSGKTTTLAALVHEINRSKARHIITIEDPIEYQHTHLQGLVEQVEIGLDAPDFPTALRAAVRQAPDVIVVGEMRDSETMRIAVGAAETGHLVLSTLHTTDVASTVSRISDSFPPERQNVVRQELAMALAAVLTQILLPSKRGGRVAAIELLMLGYAGRQHIRRNSLQHLHQEITMTKNKGSFTLEESLAQLVKHGHIDREEALIAAFHPDDLISILKAGTTARM
ncbi:MAG TPA: PilT/PilU family type 4a pilus ATPase [Terriglobales bacterium]|nr:PilT/PilU family type 4a pilus ATPase [Terriglobales bacterium]